MKNKLASFICLAFFAVSAMGTGKKKPEDAGLPVATATVEPTATATTTSTAKPGKKPSAGDGKPDPAADYKGFEDANLDGKKAFGKTVLARMRRTSSTESTFTGYTCNDKGGGSNSALLSYTDAQRNSVRAMPMLTNYRDTCPRVLFKIKGTQNYSKNFRGDVVEILDVTPEEAEAPPAGADYGSLDAVMLDGPARYKGKTVEFEAYRTGTKDKYINVTQCNAGGGFMELKFTADQRDAVKSVSTEYNHCSTIKAKLGSPSPYSRYFLNAQLVSVK